MLTQTERKGRPQEVVHWKDNLAECRRRRSRTQPQEESSKNIPDTGGIMCQGRGERRVSLGEGNWFRAVGRQAWDDGVTVRQEMRPQAWAGLHKVPCVLCRGRVYTGSGVTC